MSNYNERLLETSEGYDVIIYAGSNDNVKEIRAHSTILCANSQYFRTTLSKEWAEKKDGKFIFKKPNTSPLLFEIILRYIYCEKVDLTELKYPDILELLLIVDELNIQSMIPCIQEYLSQHNPMVTLEKIYQYESFTELCKICLEKICHEPELIFESDEFLGLEAPLMELILKQDLELDEIIIWGHLIEWSQAQNPTIPQDVTKWNEEELLFMKNGALGKIIPSIRFYHISPENFLDKVYPFKRLLPESLLDNILAFHITPYRELKVDMLPPRKRYGSMIIKPQHFALFPKWIYGKGHLHRSIPYDFKLIYRASRDGIDTKTFHDKCDSNGPTIFVAKIKGSNQVVGGYNPLNWYEEGYKYTSKSFIFSFKDHRDVKTGRLARITKGREKHAVYCDNGFGPAFGYSGDLNFDGKEWSASSDSYDHITIPFSFEVDDYEVFQVIKGTH